MNKVTSISLNGNMFQLEDPGFETLTSYLSDARTRLTDNPDLPEIMADLEQAIADKFSRFLSAHKSVVTSDEVNTAIKEMGPVQTESGGGANPSSDPAARPKRLYRIEEGSWVAGIATGLAAYLDIDVQLVRLAMVILLILTSGGFIFGYLLAWIFIPAARTQEQQAKAYGAPVTAEEVIARAKQEYAKFGGKSKQWKQDLATWKKEQKRQKRAYWQQHRYDWNYGPRHRRSTLGQLVTLLILSFLLWLGYHHVPDVHSFLDATWQLVLRTGNYIAETIVSKQ